MNAQRPLAILTGASSGIGAALAPRLAEQGYDLLLVARRAERLESLAERLRAEQGLQVQALPLDLCAEGAAAQVCAAGARASLLVNNAGLGHFGEALEHSVEDEARVVRLNCEALLRLSLEMAPKMVSRGEGIILNVSSIAAFQPLPSYAVYGASKAFVQAFSEALDEELRPRGVRVVTVCPGPVPTEFQANAGSPDARQAGSWSFRSPEQIAASCLRLIKRPQPRLLPAPLDRVLLWAQRWVPRTTVVRQAGRQLRRRTPPKKA